MVGMEKQLIDEIRRRQKSWMERVYLARRGYSKQCKRVECQVNEGGEERE